MYVGYRITWGFSWISELQQSASSTYWESFHRTDRKTGKQTDLGLKTEINYEFKLTFHARLFSKINLV